MMFRTGIWLWLCIGQNVLREGGGLNCQKQHKKSDCYQLNRVRCSFREAQYYCHRQGGQLMSTWNQDIRDRLRDYLEEGKKWWIGPGSDPLIKHERKGDPEVSANLFTRSGLSPPNRCTYVIRNWDLVSSKEDLCSKEHFFICQGDAFQDDPHDNHESDGKDAQVNPTSKKKKWGMSKMRNEIVSDHHLSSRCHGFTDIYQPTTLCQETSTNILVSSVMAQTPEQILLAISSPAKRQHLPMTTKFSKPLSEVSSEKPVSEAPATPKEPPYLHVFTADPQILSEAMGNVNRSIHDFHLVQNLQRACEILQQLNKFASQFSKTVQTSATNSLFYRNEQLLKVQSPSRNPFSLKAPIALCSFDSFDSSDYDMEGSRMSQMEDTLETSLIALGKIQEALLLTSQPLESSMIVTSSLATLMLRSQNISTLSSISYTLGCPAPMRLDFLSASALDNLLSKHQSVNIQVTGLAFNPFKYFDEKDIVGSIGNVLLTSNYKSLQIQDLLEEAEIILWRDGSIEIYPTSFNMSTDCFVITINITSLEESLIVWVEPENPLSITLYLGFQYQPNVTHFHLNITLPKEQTWEKDEKYSWVLSPENLQNGTGTYYITAVVNEIKKDPEQTFLRFSVTTAATQCYFWDHHNKTWKSNGCRVGPQSTITKTQCLCNHLASFGSSFMALPRTVNIQDTVKLFHGVSRNPVGVSLLASLMGFYIIFVVWAWRKDREDRKKMKVTILADNSPNSQAYYLVQVFTGYRRRAATTAKVILILYGSEGRSDPHHLSDPHKVVFEQGAQDVFLLTTRSPLGELHSIRLWHDNSGTSPSWEVFSFYSDWYVNQVIVSNLATRKKWYFLCNCWLAVDLGDCQQDQVFTSVSKKELFSFRNLYSSMIVEKFTQEHLWLSVVTCSPWNQVTRVQRLSCCMTLLICSMVINIMFWKLNSTEEDDGTVRDGVGPFAVTWSELFISIQTASILFPINLIIGRIFPLIQPTEKIPPHFIPIQASSTSDTSFGSVTTQKIIEELKETVGFLHMKNACLPSEWEGSKGSCDSVTDLIKGFSSLIHSHLEKQGSQWQQTGSHLANEVPENLHNLNHYLLRVLERLQFQCSTLLASPSGRSHDFLYSASQLQSIRELVETQILSMAQGPCSDITSFPMLDSEEEKSTISNHLPKWSVYICWLLLGATSLVSAFFTVLYSLKLNKDQATSWVISMVLSVLQNIFIIQPVKCLNLGSSPNSFSNYLPGNEVKQLLQVITCCPPPFQYYKIFYYLSCSRVILKVMIFTLFFSMLLTRIPWRNKEQDQQMRRILALLARCPSLSPPGLRDENNPIYRVPPVKRPVKAQERTAREQQLFQLSREIFVQILFLVMLMISTHSERNHNKFYFNQAIQTRLNHFEEIRRIKDFYQWANNILIPNLYGKYRGFIAEGNSFLIGSVQIRQIRIPDTVSFPNRISPSEQVKPYYQHHQEDQKNYGAHWAPLDLNSTNQGSIWCHQSEEALGGYPIQGQFAVYSGGGYAVTLGNGSEGANRILQQLKQSHWLDRRTTSLFVAFVVYNANVNLFCVVTLILESNGVGAFFSSIKVNSLQIIQTHRGFIWFIASKVIYFLLLLYHLFTQGNRLRQQRWKYFTKKSNALDTSIILISFIMLALQLKCFFLHKRDMEQYRHNKSRFISFHETVQVTCALTYLLGFLVLLTTIRLWSLLRLSPRLRVVSTTLKRAWDEVAGFLLIILLLLTGYSIAFNILFGWSISDYRTFFNSAVTIVGLLMGIFDYQEVVDLDPVLGSFLIITSVILLVLVIINLFVSAIMLTFCKERKSIMAQKEAPLTEILLQKLSNLLGIRRPQKAVLPEQTDPAAAGNNTDASEDEPA
ncbi:LOW QUALITY PROTEIN: polycystin-1-like protein 3 [Petaurus breviceps papuanus]|uniref:LOW QUALITY PROTEIN: polycystin-1-like protein 3 n=1 Tax=Petaurus breviceps papuanus TaxID=3040969 RepID=UPI0036DA3199